MNSINNLSPLRFSKLVSTLIRHMVRLVTMSAMMWTFVSTSTTSPWITAMATTSTSATTSSSYREVLNSRRCGRWVTTHGNTTNTWQISDKRMNCLPLESGHEPDFQRMHPGQKGASPPQAPHDTLIVLPDPIPVADKILTRQELPLAQSSSQSQGDHLITVRTISHAN